jgi:hypothetical protein
MDKLKQGLAEVERVAEELLTAKQQIVEIDLARNRNREASTALRKQLPSAGGSFGNVEKGYLLRPGGFFIRLSTEKAQEVIKKGSAPPNPASSFFRNYVLIVHTSRSISIERGHGTVEEFVSSSKP